MTDGHKRGKEVSGSAPVAEKKVSDETLKRFKDFVRARATNPPNVKLLAAMQGVPAEAVEVNTSKTEGKFSVSKTEGELISATSIEYDYFDYTGTDEERGDDAQMTINAGIVPEDEVEVFGLYICDDGINYSVGPDFPAGKADDTIVNNVLSQIEELEAAGKITPVVQQG